MHPQLIKQALLLGPGWLWQCWQLTDKEGIHLCKQAVGDGLIVKVMPTFILLDLEVEAMSNACRGQEARLNTVQEITENDEKHQPQHPCLDKTDCPAEQGIQRAKQWNAFRYITHGGAENVEDKRGPEKQDEV